MENRAVDALSKKGKALELITLSIPKVTNLGRIDEEGKKDPILLKVCQEVLTNSSNRVEYTLKNGTLFFKGRLVSSENLKFILLLLKEFHTSQSGGHSDFFSGCTRGYKVWYTGKALRDRKRFAASCDICQRSIYSSLSLTGLVQPLPISQQVWEDTSMDFVAGLSKSQSWDTIFMAVDCLTTYTHFIPFRHPYIAKEVAKTFVKEIVKLLCFLRTIISDRNRIFITLQERSILGTEKYILNPSLH